jgi:hypothetical protein
MVRQATLFDELDGELDAEGLERMVLAEAVGHELLAPDEADVSRHWPSTLSAVLR